MKSIELINEISIPDKQSRRSFVINSLKGAVLFASGSALLTFLNSCGSDDGNPASPNSSSGPRTITVDISQSKYSSLQTIGGVVTLSKGDESGLPANGLFLVRSSSSQVRAFDRTCTHQGCQVGAFSSGLASCPCHGSQFNDSGGVVRGPASSSLKSYSTSLTGNQLEISIS
ncbi:MAG: Rieske 2Fe-2S domain-containing protein [Melioribacteraceae bacterium]|nr:Rieske 2Fe-2S domain-containing protein [Melioribacteraceae bacterium]MCF8353645.1 Rieske 2Fe-2S domain-containing protein [Melioribacteraceae bacterium]MCF8393415.1 Rieske 2Fe-2S domain-containing protein [Melioribacteraceae bacterium]MCF8419272.1 Rieske 2Fe-2S domain-containing protein [Melioribacteraceae bacterium]